ncbi:MAG: phospholipid carrier-dependent glycosyltransferase [Thermodesulfobacteriota bacterium]
MIEQSFFLKYKVELVLVLVLIFGVVIRLYRLETPDSYYFDEVYFAFTAQEMAKGNHAAWESSSTAPAEMAYEWTHPPLGKEISAIGILIFGDNTFGWRFFQAVFGGLGILLIYFLGKNLFESKGAGLIAALLYCFESFFFVLSRITMVDIFIADFLILASLFIVKYARTRRYSFLLWSGLFCGAGMSIKWSGLYITEYLAGVALVLMYYFEVYTAKSRDKEFVSSVIGILPRIALAFIVIPFLLYLATYLPFFYHGNSIRDYFVLQGNMLGYHEGVTETHPYQSAWWQWPIMMRPVYLYYQDFGEGLMAYIYMLGNIFIWYTGLLFLILGIVQALKKEKPALIFTVLSVFAYWLPWAFSPRKITFIYHFLPSLVFLLLVSTYFLNNLWRYSKRGKLLVIFYFCVAASVFFYFYPVLAAVPMKESDINRYMWLSTWR